METEKNSSEQVQGTAGNSRNLQGTAGNGGEPPEIVKLLAKHPEMRRDLISLVKREFGFNIETLMEDYFGEMPDKKLKLEDIAMPVRELAENVLGMTDDGYAPSQVAAELGIYRSEVTRILKARSHWEKEIAGAAKKVIVQNKKLPWWVRLAAKLHLAK